MFEKDYSCQKTPVKLTFLLGALIDHLVSMAGADVGQIAVPVVGSC